LAENGEFFLSEGMIDEMFFSSEVRFGDFEVGLDFGSFFSDLLGFFSVFLFILFSQVFEQLFGFLGTIFEAGSFYRHIFYDKIDWGDILEGFDVFGFVLLIFELVLFI
jgi:hypothetical protein